MASLPKTAWTAASPGLNVALEAPLEPTRAPRQVSGGLCSQDPAGSISWLQEGCVAPEGLPRDSQGSPAIATWSVLRAVPHFAKPGLPDAQREIEEAALRVWGKSAWARAERADVSRRFRGRAVLLQASRKSSPLSTWDGPGGHGKGASSPERTGWASPGRTHRKEARSGKVHPALSHQSHGTPIWPQQPDSRPPEGLVGS